MDRRNLEKQQHEQQFKAQEKSADKLVCSPVRVVEELLTSAVVVGHQTSAHIERSVAVFRRLAQDSDTLHFTGQTA